MDVPFVGRQLERADVVLEEAAHGEAVEGLLGVAAYAGVVHVGGHYHPQFVFAASVRRNRNVRSV